MKKGFTLAEVLVTLGIIGVVSAMTLPSIINAIQDKTFHAKWKSTYSILNNAFNLTKEKNPGIRVFIGGQNAIDQEFIDAFLENVQVADSCGFSPLPPCTIWYNSKKFTWSGVAPNSSATKYATLNGEAMLSYGFNSRSVLLNNGASIYFGYHMILVDVNNYNGKPNILGRDVFAISLLRTWYNRDMFIEEIGMKPFGAQNTYNSKTELGSTDCDKNIGSGNSWVPRMAGAGCSYKYLIE